MNLLIYGILLFKNESYPFFLVENPDRVSSYIIFQSIVGKEQKTKLRSSNTGSILDNNISKSFIPDINSTDDNYTNICNK